MDKEVLELTPKEAKVVMTALVGLETSLYIRPDIAEVAEELFERLATWRPLVEYVRKEQEEKMVDREGRIAKAKETAGIWKDRPEILAYKEDN